MEKKKYYVVKIGRLPGIYNSWDGKNGARQYVDGYPNSRYKRFSTMEEAQAWMNLIEY